MAVNEMLLELDSRKRVTLGRMAHHDRYLAHEEPGGTIVLVPAAVMTDAQARLLASGEVVEAIDAFLANPAGTGVRRGRPRRR